MAEQFPLDRITGERFERDSVKRTMEHCRAPSTTRDGIVSKYRETCALLRVTKGSSSTPRMSAIGRFLAIHSYACQVGMQLPAVDPLELFNQFIIQEEKPPEEEPDGEA